MSPFSDKEEIETLYRITSNKVSWRVFSATIGIMLAIFGAVLGWLVSVDNDTQSRIEAMQPQFIAIQTQLAQIQVDLTWVKASLADNK
jgi:hypothetical protein